MCALSLSASCEHFSVCVSMCGLLINFRRVGGVARRTLNLHLCSFDVQAFAFRTCL